MESWSAQSCKPPAVCWHYTSFGFIDGTIRAIARPEQHQMILYNGHKRVYALKFQSIAPPNGLIGNVYGPAGK